MVNKKPAQLRLLEGRGDGKDAAGRPVKTAPPTVVRKAPPCPSWLSPEAKKEWRRVVPLLETHSMAKREDLVSLSAYCEAAADFIQATRELSEHVAKEGTVNMEAPQGLIPHPAVRAKREAMNQVRSWAREFGLTPSTEEVLAGGGAGGDDEENPFA